MNLKVLFVLFVLFVGPKLSKDPDTTNASRRQRYLVAKPSDKTNHSANLY
jgi:hypothetical protein